MSRWFMVAPIWIWLFFSVFSLCLGSFLNVVIYRLPLILQRQWREDCLLFLNPSHDLGNTPKNPPLSSADALFTPRSSCPSCQHRLHIHHLLPLLSYLWLKGKCAFCKTQIPYRYPLVEAATLLLNSLAFLKFGLDFLTPLVCLLNAFLIVLLAIDWDHHILPDQLTLSLLWMGLLSLSLGLPGFTDIHSAVLGAVFGYVFLWSVAYAFKRLMKKEGMGHGDFKLFSALGAWFGIDCLPELILNAALIGLISGLFLLWFQKKSRQSPIPFGPFLSLSAWMHVFY